MEAEGVARVDSFSAGDLITSLRQRVDVVKGVRLGHFGKVLNEHLKKLDKSQIKSEV